MVPMWTRAWRFANVYAYAAVDILFALLWFAAFIAVAVWESDGVRKGTSSKNTKRKDNKPNNTSNRSGSCSQFAFGSEAKCEVAKASVGFGVVIFLLFGVTSALSIQGVMRYRRTGVMPSGDPRKQGKVEQLGVEDPNKDAWDANTDDLNPNDSSNRHSDEGDDPRRAYGQIPAEEDEQGLLHRASQHEDPFQDAHSTLDTQTGDGAHPGRPLSYQSSMNLSIAQPPSYHEEAPTNAGGGSSPSGYVAPSALSPTDYEQTPGGRINFPQGNYGADFSYR